MLARLTSEEYRQRVTANDPFSTISPRSFSAYSYLQLVCGSFDGAIFTSRTKSTHRAQSAATHYLLKLTGTLDIKVFGTSVCCKILCAHKFTRSILIRYTASFPAVHAPTMP